MKTNFDGVYVFVETVEAGSFAQAGERLSLTRSAIGKTIARLEESLGTRLFQRTTRTQSLTEEGIIFYERCQRAIAELRAGEALLDSGRREIAGKLKVSMPVLFGRHCVAPLLLELATKHVGLQLDLRFSDQVVDVIGEGIDLAIRNGTPGSSAGLHTRKIASQVKIVCASPGYLEANGTPHTIAALQSHAALVYWRNDHLFPWTLKADDGTMVDADLTWRYQFDNQEALADAAASGHGIAHLPRWLIRDHLSSGRLVPLLVDNPSPVLETFAVWPSARYLPMRLRIAIDTLAENLQHRFGL